jgi:thiamine pyrophosphokinase
MGNVVIINGGDPVAASVVTHLPADAFVIAVDRGLDHATALGLRTDLVVGDLDSVSAVALQSAEARGTCIEKHPSDKDATDLELALLAAARCRPGDAITVVSGGGGRFDHDHAVPSILAGAARPGAPVRAFIGRALVIAVRGPDEVVVRGEPGSVVSLLPVAGSAIGVTITGVRWPLHDETLDPFAGRAVSNELITPEARLTLSSGSLLVIQPEVLP